MQVQIQKKLAALFSLEEMFHGFVLQVYWPRSIHLIGVAFMVSVFPALV